jgi:hypothetical protein
MPPCEVIIQQRFGESFDLKVGFHVSPQLCLCKADKVDATAVVTVNVVAAPLAGTNATVAVCNAMYEPYCTIRRVDMGRPMICHVPIRYIYER